MCIQELSQCEYCLLLCSLAQYFNAGVLSGVLTAVISIPGDRIKCIMQVRNSSYPGSVVL